MYNTELKHYGVPGMRWGVRNKSVANSNKRKTSKPSAKGKKIVGAIIGGTALAGISIAAVRGAKYSKVINAGKDLIKNLDTNISILNNR